MTNTARQIRDFFADRHHEMRWMMTWVLDDNSELPRQVDRSYARARGLQTYETETEALLAQIDRDNERARKALRAILDLEDTKGEEDASHDPHHRLAVPGTRTG